MIAWKKAFSLVFRISLMRVLISRVIVLWDFLSSPHVARSKGSSTERASALSFKSLGSKGISGYAELALLFLSKSLRNCLFLIK